MDEIKINDKISYIASSENPLSAEIGIIRDNGITWLYDVGNGENHITDLDGGYNIVLSHFHQDHIGNINKIQTRELYLSKETYEYISKGKIVCGSLYIGNLHIFPLPSSHTKGSLGLEVDNTYAFVGDALYSKVRDGCYIYDARILQEEIAVLKKLNATFLLVSHFEGFIRRKEDVIAELEMIYEMREQNDTEIKVKIDTE
jgi:glyoxylase-like metal-dependent hydrolase (beta-lactamase superfamily II)